MTDSNSTTDDDEQARDDGTADGVTLADVLTTLNDIGERERSERAEIVVLTDWRVGSDGRLHIPKDKREKYDIEEGDYIDAILRIPTEPDDATNGDTEG